ncbi:hypothetical protein PoB_003479000 [Plakobranchus ocellatus]|uniref:Reverse transcriptase domain-containing protein n=1 Tax=Plakobranchus ocellatus TaxID=259542 RepID=A0AAV4ALP5_9GAST|nr:hypothetical protein PoB_003479000 [Plakobranchus ocellatus]
MLEDIDEAFAIMDDILTAEKDLNEHNEILKKVLYSATEYNLKINMGKVRIRQESIEHCGHIITSEGLKTDTEKIRAHCKNKENQKYYHERKTKLLRDLQEAIQVQLQPTAGNKHWLSGSVVKRTDPGSYQVETDNGVYRRNRRRIKTATEQANKRHYDFSLEQYEVEDDMQETVGDNYSMPNAAQPHVEILPSPTHRNFSSSRPLTDSVSPKAHSNNTSYTARSGRLVTNRTNIRGSSSQMSTKLYKNRMSFISGTHCAEGGLMDDFVKCPGKGHNESRYPSSGSNHSLTLIQDSGLEKLVIIQDSNGWELASVDYRSCPEKLE